MRPKLFSVIIPTYNRALTIKHTLTSVFNSNDSSLFDVTIVDDGSTDNTSDLVASCFPLATYIYIPNSERSIARNTGILSTSGKYLIFLDSDDCLPPSYINKLAAIIHEHELPPVLVTLSSYRNLDYLPFIRSSTRSVFSLSPLVLLLGNPFSCNITIKRTHINYPFNQERSILTMEDWIFLFQNTMSLSSLLLCRGLYISQSSSSDRSMYNNKRVISARRSATSFLSRSAFLSLNSRRRLINYSHLFNSIHYLLDGDRTTCLATLLRVKPIYLDPISLLKYIYTLIRLVVSCFIPKI